MKKILKKSLFAIFSLITFCNLALAQSKKEAFDFKGIRLGITLSEFKQLPPPQSSKPFNTTDKIEPVKVVCTDTEKNSLKITVYSTLINAGEYKYGGVNCEYGYDTISYPNTANPFTIYKQAELLMGDYSSYSNSFRFIKLSEDAEPILYKMQFTFSENGFKSVANGLKEKFGNAKTSNVAVQNKVGGVFNSTVMQWNNSVSTIQLERFFTTVNTSGLVYFLNKENSLVNKATAESKKNSM